MSGYHDQARESRKSTGIFQKISVEETPFGECKDFMARFTYGVKQNHLCGRAIYARQNLCGLRLGAPLQILIENVYYVGGITSKISYHCSPYPTVFTRIASYLDWIEERVWPDEV